MNGPPNLPPDAPSAEDRGPVSAEAVPTYPAAVIQARPVSRPIPRPWSVMELQDVPRRAAGLDLALVVLVALVIPFGAEIAVALVEPKLLADLSLDPLVVRKSFDALLLIGLSWYLLRRNDLPPEALGLHARGLGRQVLWSVPTLLAVYLAFLFVMLIIVALIAAIPALQGDVESRLEFIRLLPLEDPVRQVLLLAPVAVHEELLFRTLLIPLLRRLTGSWIWAVLLSAALFAPLHIAQGLLGVVQIFTVGLVFGAFFVLSRSTLAVIIAHFCFNLLQMQVARWAQDLVSRGDVLQNLRG